MASNPYVKSLIWLLSLGGVGYALLKITEPSEAKLQEIRKSTPVSSLTEQEKQKILFLRKLKQAAEEKPVYLAKKD
ncbi:uncharacterized protein LOC129905260 isoform X2 [Episyrphus balteatus]|uniref:uncharacterized protein LOC129905260 isoform X2 n=1 Tax=Episyrphus balteatus TaxID=286459 RepID=UPI00248513DF|nr:uncharacterized protein LOC129905260 isoform X2 [Episyrphus balteatus]XP_055836670.1 uncharacterized protein LOC129905260 isoform X2 [Episyrphus balteatus]